MKSNKGWYWYCTLTFSRTLGHWMAIAPRDEVKGAVVIVIMACCCSKARWEHAKCGTLWMVTSADTGRVMMVVGDDGSA